jgi:hypothetical protein
MAVREDQRRDRLVAQVLACKGHRGGGGLARGGGVHHDPARLAFDERDVGEVEAAQLPDAFAHLEEADLVVEQCLPPQAGVHGGRRRALHEGEGVEVPHHGAGFVQHLPARRGDEAAAGVGEGGRVGQVGGRGNLGVGTLHRCRHLGLDGWHVAPARAARRGAGQDQHGTQAAPACGRAVPDSFRLAC